MHTALAPRITVPAAVAMAFFSSCAVAQTAAESFTIDFESLAEEIEISNQFAAFGVVFAIDDNPAALPVIVQEGEPMVGFIGIGADAPMASGITGLSDPIVQGDPLLGQDIAMLFDPPVTSVRMFLIDIDGEESVTLRAYDGATEVDSFTRSCDDIHAGDGLATEFFVSAASITSVVVDAPELIGFAIDYITCTRTCAAPPCPPQIRIAQESAPGVGDFEDNILGYMPPIASPFSAAEAYAWNLIYRFTYSGQSIQAIDDRSHLYLSQNTDGLTLHIIQDKPYNTDGGMAEMSFSLAGDPDGAFLSVMDDDFALPNGDLFTGDPGDSLFTAALSWGTCCTDGLALTGLDGDWSMIIQFTEVDGQGTTPPIEGLTEWIAYSGDGTQYSLALETDRRVRLDVMSGPPPACPADVNGDSVVDVLDLLAVLAAWGAPGGPEDINNDGVVDVLDLLQVLAAWGPC